MPAFELVGQETSEGQQPRGRQVWRIADVPDAPTARAVAWSAAPVVFDGLLKQDAQIVERVYEYADFASLGIGDPWS